MTGNNTISNEAAYYKPNGKMVFFEKADLLTWIRQNRYSSKAEISEEADRIIRKLAAK